MTGPGARKEPCANCRAEFLRGATAVLAHITTSGEAGSTSRPAS
jgi:hypothetical protein